MSRPRLAKQERGCLDKLRLSDEAGARAMAGWLTARQLAALRDANGTTFLDAATAAGLPPTTPADAIARYARFIEKFTDAWHYFRAYHEGMWRDEIQAQFQPSTIEALDLIEEYIGQ